MAKTWDSIQDLLRQKLLEDPRAVKPLCRAVGLAVWSYYRFTRGEGSLNGSMIDRLMKEYGIVAVERKRRQDRRRG